MEDALQFLDYAREILPLWFQVAILVTAGLALIGGGYALWKLRSKPTEEAGQWIVLPDQETRCLYCAGYRNRSIHYDEWDEFMADVRDVNVCIDHILERCAGRVPAKPPSPQEIIDARIEARLAAAQAKVYPGGQRCGACRDLV